MVVEPTVKHDIEPDDEPTVATAVLLLVHVPPAAPSVSDRTLPRHAGDEPPMLVRGLTETI
jgi:hypothetical protein